MSNDYLIDIHNENEYPLAVFPSAGAALELRLPDGSVFQGSSLSVGRAVDVLVELLCVETSGGGQPGSWQSAMGGEPVFVGLQPFGQTQELGLLRIYTLPETQSFECVSPVSADPVTVQFVLGESDLLW